MDLVQKWIDAGFQVSIGSCFGEYWVNIKDDGENGPRLVSDGWSSTLSGAIQEAENGIKEEA